jgi:predicted O-methyltransferase YrrM
LLKKLTADCTDLEELIEITQNVQWFRPNQKRTEILNLLKLVQQLRPRALLEIGAANGGTLFLLTRAAEPNARILSLDFAISPVKQAIFPTFARPGQQVNCMRGDSHSADTLQRVKEWLGGKQLDFLFIDGDHSYEGVRRDYEMYGPLVATGGLIAFHDIVADFKTRYGTPTLAYTGEVPQFWAQLKTKTTVAGEIIQHPNQDGCGIGYLRVGAT